MYNENDIITLKLVTGEEVVTRFISETPGEFTIYKPLTLMPSREGMALAQSIMSAKLDRNITVNKSTVIMHTYSREEMSSAWLQATSGLAMPNSKVLME
mgnify:FL=1|jgi:hypothetical protein